MQSFDKELFEIAKKYNYSFKEVADAALEFAKQGLNMDENLKRTKNALTLSEVAGIETKKSTKSLTSAINSFKN